MGAPKQTLGTRPMLPARIARGEVSTSASNGQFGRAADESSNRAPTEARKPVCYNSFRQTEVLVPFRLPLWRVLQRSVQ